MQRSLTVGLAFILGATVTLGQTHPNSGPPPIPPRDIVEEVWKMGVSGELLTAEGWTRASGYFVEPNPKPQDKSFDVISNDYGFPDFRINNNKAEVFFEFTDAGRIDSKLHYSPPPPARYYKTAKLFRLVLTPTYMRMFGPDGKTEIERKPTGQSSWEIEDHLDRPWTTVNSAIRHVLEIRNKTTDPVIQKNADETIAKLLKWR
jgi:hypothetical protein